MKQIFILSYGDGGRIGIYSTVKKAFAAAVGSFENRNFTASGSQVAIGIQTLKQRGEFSFRLLATEATNQYDENKTLVIDKETVQ